MVPIRATTMIYNHSTLILLLHVRKYDLHVHRIADVITTIWIDLVISLHVQFKNLQGDSKSQELAGAQFISLQESTRQEIRNGASNPLTSSTPLG